jgi:hypothetical protein
VPGGKLSVEEAVAMELTWKEVRVDAKFDVIALSRPKSGTLWALGHGRRMFSAVTAILHRRAGLWKRAFVVDGRLDTIATLGDGSILATGEWLSVLFDGERWSTTESGLKRSHRIWGAHLGCANALTLAGQLFCFDGRWWEYVDLEGYGIDGTWADGDCDTSGRGWIVGTNGSHSCMATGSGLRWQRDGCGSWYLNRVYVAEDGRAFAAGGDGVVWRYDGSKWSTVGSGQRRVGGPLPLALSAAGPDPIVVACAFEQITRLEKHTAELLAFNATGWHPFRVPVAMKPPGRTGLAIDTTARLLLIPTGPRSIWESSPLTGP